MLESLTKFGKELGHELSRAWENLSDGWRELLTRSSSALTRFTHKAPSEDTGSGTASESPFPAWGLLAGEMYDEDGAVVVRLELPGVNKNDIELSVEGNVLMVRGEKRYESERISSAYYLRERAYGSFQRAVTLPQAVDIERAQASCRDGVLTVRLPKLGGTTQRRNIPLA